MESRSSSKKSSKKNKLKGEIRVGNGEYRLGKLLGSGSFGVIYEGHNVNTGQIVAVKLEKVSTSPPGHPQLRFERGIYKILANNVGVPSIYFYGKEEQYYVLIMDLLGPSLEDLFNFCNRKFSLKTILMLADQMLQRVELVHQYQFIHRDIKPDNFLIGLFENFNKIFIIDFGLSKRYMNPKTQEHIPFINGKSLTGTARYASINTHLGCEQSRRDDLETLGYVLIYFAKRGKLPWQGLKAKDKNEKYSRIAQVKQQTTIDDLCAKIPAKSAFIKYLQYCRKLEFTEEPNYQYLRGLFYSVAKKYSYTYDQEFDWVLLAKQYARQKEEQQQQQQQQTQLSQQGQSSSQQMQSHDRKMSLSRRAQLSHENSGHMPISPYGDPNSQQLQPQSASHLYATNQYGQQGNVQQAQVPPMAQYQQQGHGTQSTQQAQAQYQAAPQYQQMAMNQHQHMHYGNNNGNYNGNGNNGNNGNNNVNHNNNNNSNNNNNNNGAPYMAMQQMAPNVRMYNQIPNYNYYGNYGNMNYNISVAGPPPPPQYDQTQQVHVSQQQAPPQHMYHASQQHLQHPQMMQHDNYLGVNGNNQYYYSHQQQHSSISKDVQPRASVSGSHLFSNSIGNNEQVSPST